MSDPAVEAARRAWDTPAAQGYGEAAAREALAPLRKLHRPMTVDEIEEEWPDWDRYKLCAECTSDIVIVPWPCATAELIYPSDELAAPEREQ